MQSLFLKLKKPFFVQAPMEDITDTVFRQIISSVGKPNLYFTEFTNADGIVKGGSTYINQRLQFSKKERPIIAQIWGNEPEYYVESAKIIRSMGFDGIDINMGCPDRKIVKHGCCSGLINNPKLAKKLYEAALNGGGGLPVSIKTRIGYNKIATNEWIGFLLRLNPSALTIHARTAKEMSKVPAHWDEFGTAVELKNKLSPETVIIANGDIESMDMGIQVVSKYGVDGVMIGRGMLRNPWVFNKELDITQINVGDRLKLLKKHIKLYDLTWGKSKNFEIMKKFYKAYINGFDGASEMRLMLVQFHNATYTIKKINELIRLEN